MGKDACCYSAMAPIAFRPTPSPLFGIYHRPAQRARHYVVQTIKKPYGEHATPHYASTVRAAVAAFPSAALHLHQLAEFALTAGHAATGEELLLASLDLVQGICRSARNSTKGSLSVWCG